MFNSTANRVALAILVIVLGITFFGGITDGIKEVAVAEAQAIVNIK